MLATEVITAVCCRLVAQAFCDADTSRLLPVSAMKLKLYIAILQYYIMLTLRTAACCMPCHEAVLAMQLILHHIKLGGQLLTFWL